MSEPNISDIKIKKVESNEVIRYLDLSDDFSKRALSNPIDKRVFINTINFYQQDTALIFHLLNPRSNPISVDINTGSISEEYCCPKGSKTIQIRVNDEKNKLLTSTIHGDVYLWNIKSRHLINRWGKEDLLARIRK